MKPNAENLLEEGAPVAAPTRQNVRRRLLLKLLPNRQACLNSFGMPKLLRLSLMN